MIKKTKKKVIKKKRASKPKRVVKKQTPVIDNSRNDSIAKIKVIGVGGSGGNVINHMIKTDIDDVEFIVANTDLQDLHSSKSKKKIHMGGRTTQGLGAGMNPVLGEKAAMESQEDIKDSIRNSDLLFIACGMGGGTGTGAAPHIAKISRDMGILTIAVVTKPFSFEGAERRRIAEEGIEKLSEYTDSIVVIPNDNILALANEKTSMSEAFSLSDDVLNKAVSGISQLITKPGDINIDFADVRTIMTKSGKTLLSLGIGKGSSKAETAITKAINSPILETSIKGARRVLFSIASRTRSEITMKEVQTIAERINDFVYPGAKIIFGTTTDRALKSGEIRVTLIATDFVNESSNKMAEEEPEKKEVETDFEEAIINDEGEETYDFYEEDMVKKKDDDNGPWKKIWKK